MRLPYIAGGVVGRSTRSLDGMLLGDHFRKYWIVYRCLSAVLAIGFVLGWLWGTHPYWWLSAAVLFAMGAALPQFEVWPAKVAFAILILPVLLTLWDRGGFGDRPWKMDANFLYEIAITAVVGWVLAAVACLTFLDRKSVV